MRRDTETLGNDHGDSGRVPFRKDELPVLGLGEGRRPYRLRGPTLQRPRGNVQTLKESDEASTVPTRSHTTPTTGDPSFRVPQESSPTQRSEQSTYFLVGVKTSDWRDTSGVERCQTLQTVGTNIGEDCHRRPNRPDLTNRNTTTATGAVAEFGTWGVGVTSRRYG